MLKLNAVNYLIVSLDKDLAKSVGESVGAFCLPLNPLIAGSPKEVHNQIEKEMLNQIKIFTNSIFVVETDFGFLSEANLREINKNAKIIFLKTRDKEQKEKARFFEIMADFVVEVRNEKQTIKDVMKLIIDRIIN